MHAVSCPAVVLLVNPAAPHPRALPQAEDELERKEWMESLQAVIACMINSPAPVVGDRTIPRKPAAPTHVRRSSNMGASPLGMAGLNLDSMDGSPSPASSVVSDESHAEVRHSWAVSPVWRSGSHSIKGWHHQSCKTYLRTTVSMTGAGTVCLERQRRTQFTTSSMGRDRVRPRAIHVGQRALP